MGKERHSKGPEIHKAKEPIVAAEWEGMIPQEKLLRAKPRTQDDSDRERAANEGMIARD